MDQLVHVTTVLANVATFLGIPLAILLLIRDRRMARHARELETYQALQSEYSDFLKLCLQNPDLPLYDYRPEIHKNLSPQQEERRMIAFEILVSMFESAFFLYHLNHESAFKKRQWTGWDQYIRDWVSREDFRACWKEHLGYQFDSEFMDYVNGLIKEAESKRGSGQAK